MKISVIKGISALQFYGYVINIGEKYLWIFFSQISMEWKLFKIHMNAWKNSKKMIK